MKEIEEPTRILLKSEKNQPKRFQYCVSPSIWHIWKRQNYQGSKLVGGEIHWLKPESSLSGGFNSEKLGGR